MQPGLRPLPVLNGHPTTAVFGPALLQADHLTATSVVWKSHWAGKALASPADRQTRRQTDGQADRQAEERTKRERTSRQATRQRTQRGNAQERTRVPFLFRKCASPNGDGRQSINTQRATKNKRNHRTQTLRALTAPVPPKAPPPLQASPVHLHLQHC